MSSNKYDKLLEKYYDGLTTADEERWLKSNTPAGQAGLPLNALKDEKVLMDWSFDDLVAQAGTGKTVAGPAKLHSLHWWKYAAAIVGLVCLGTAYFYNSRKEVHNGQALVKEIAQPRTELESLPTTPDSSATLQPVAGIRPTIVKTISKHRKNKILPAQKPLPPPANDDFLVMVNGRAITNEKEAIAVLEQSLTMLSGDVKETMTGLNNSPKLNFKFK